MLSRFVRNWLVTYTILCFVLFFLCPELHISESEYKNRRIGSFRISGQREVLISLRICAGWSGHMLSAYRIKTFLQYITKTRLFKYTENFTIKKGKFADKNF